jgi:hypothetical protein
MIRPCPEFLINAAEQTAPFISEGEADDAGRKIEVSMRMARPEWEKLLAMLDLVYEQPVTLIFRVKTLLGNRIFELEEGYRLYVEHVGYDGYVHETFRCRKLNRAWTGDLKLDVGMWPE